MTQVAKSIHDHDYGFNRDDPYYNKYYPKNDDDWMTAKKMDVMAYANQQYEKQRARDRQYRERQIREQQMYPIHKIQSYPPLTKDILADFSSVTRPRSIVQWLDDQVSTICRSAFAT